ncbi:right-handed parallel beta-helix repeat-containing protein [bacterium]|nr:right-handed parallel beta-helix repeat-containing protein [bacterium]
MQTNYVRLLLGLVAIPLCLPAFSLTLYVSPDGNDAWSGKLQTANRQKTDGPVASLTGARDAVRRLKVQGPLTEPVTVRISPGAYVMAEPLVLEPQDSGTEQAPITYQGVPYRSIFPGGRKITGFKPGPGGVWQATVPGVAAGDYYFEQLWINGRRMIRARTPNAEDPGETPQPRYLYVWKKMPFGVDPVTGQQVDMSRRAFYARPGDVACLADVPQNGLNDVTLVSYHAWETARHRLQSVDLQTGAVITTGNAPWAFQWLGVNHRYHLENFRAALDAPGEWYLDRDGTLSVMPLPGTDMTTATVVAPVIPEFIRVQGDPEAGLYVEHVTLRGLDFFYTAHTLEPQGHGDGQAAVSVPAAIMVDGARNVTFDRLYVAHTGGTYGLWFRRGCRNCRVTQSEFFDLGAGGIKIGETLIQSKEALQTHGCVADNNLIHAGGRTFPGAVGVWIGQSSDNQVTHNDISDLYYTGVSVGWSWGYRDTICKRNRTEFNHIHHLGWGVMSDMGGVYTLGIQDGASVSSNVIHDIMSWNKFGAAGLGLYNDEGSTHITMENNLVYNTRDSTYHQHYGRENIVRNNILVNGQDRQISYAREEEHVPYTFESNIVYFTTGTLFWQTSPGKRQWRFDRNVYWREGGGPFDFCGLSFADWQALGQDQHSVIADPMFRDVANLDFTLAADSPALKLGFKPFDYKQAGLYGDPDWTKRVPRHYAPVQMAPDPPPPPPLVLNEDFEAAPVGAQPAEGTLNLEGKGDSILVTDETAAAGTKSLKFTDAEGLAHSFDPHLVYGPRYEAGAYTCSYDVRLEPGAELWQEYRDWSVSPYVIGPSLKFADGKLYARDKELMALPTGQWCHIEVTAKLGAGADGHYQLTVTLPGGQPQQFSLPCVDAKWNKLTWVGFVSNATSKTVLYLDNVKLQNLAP